MRSVIIDCVFIIFLFASNSTNPAAPFKKSSTNSPYQPKAPAYGIKGYNGSGSFAGIFKPRFPSARNSGAFNF